MKKIIPLLLCSYLISTNIQAQETNTSTSPNLGPPIVVIGKYMPDTLLQDTLKQFHTISEYLGKYLLINFWAGDCGPCVRSIPELKETYENNSDKFTIVSINLDTYRYSFRKGTEVKKFTWPSLWDGGEGFDSGKRFQGFAKRYNVTGIPAYVWISPEGIVLKQWSGYGEGSLERELGQLLKNIDIKK